MDINIRVTPTELKNQSDQVIADIRLIKKSWQEIGRLIQGSKGYWEGEASDAHIAAYNDMKDEAEKVLVRLGENPVKLQQMAGVYIAGEQDAAAVAKTLPDNVF